MVSQNDKILIWNWTQERTLFFYYMANADHCFETLNLYQESKWTHHSLIQWPRGMCSRVLSKAVGLRHCPGTRGAGWWCQVHSEYRMDFQLLIFPAIPSSAEFQNFRESILRSQSTPKDFPLSSDGILAHTIVLSNISWEPVFMIGISIYRLVTHSQLQTLLSSSSRLSVTHWSLLIVEQYQ